jgi:hypothetical protein
MVARPDFCARRQDCASLVTTGLAPPLGWHRRKRERLYNWALTPLWRLEIGAGERRYGHYLLLRRSLDEKREHACYVVYASGSKVTRQTLVNVAGRRWEIEMGFDAVKGECDLDQYEFVAGRAGTVTSRWPCWRTRCLLP